MVYKHTCRVMAFVHDEDIGEARRVFQCEKGYPAEFAIADSLLLRLGPIYPTQTKFAFLLREGDCLLANGVWVTVGAVEVGADSVTVLGTDDSLITYGKDDRVTVRQ